MDRQGSLPGTIYSIAEATGQMFIIIIDEWDALFRSYFISFDDGARLEIMNKPGMEDPEKAKLRTGYIHVAFSVGSKEKVDRLTELLKSDGYEVVSGPRTTGDGYYESCIAGVEGNQIEITV